MRPSDSPKNSLSLRQALRENGIVFVPGQDVMSQADIGPHFKKFAEIWSDLPADPYFKGSRPTRFRRHGQLLLDANANTLDWLPLRGYFQSVEYNPLFGGIVRHFASIEREETTERTLYSLIKMAANSVFGIDGTWLVNVHFVRTVSDPSSSTPPAPEGPHRDGYDYIAIHLVDRDNDRGGETLILDQSNRELQRLTLGSPLDGLYMDDRRYRHHVTPIIADSRPCYRDMILMSYERPQEFQGWTT